MRDRTRLTGVLRYKLYDKNGKTFFRRKVNHPGFEGYHFIERGVRQTEQNLERRIIQETERFMEKERLK